MFKNIMKGGIQTEMITREIIMEPVKKDVILNNFKFQLLL